jgi:hypothetical protein
MKKTFFALIWVKTPDRPACAEKLYRLRDLSSTHKIYLCVFYVSENNENLFIRTTLNVYSAVRTKCLNTTHLNQTKMSLDTVGKYKNETGKDDGCQYQTTRRHMFCGLHYDAVSVMSVVGPLMNGEREGIRKEFVVVLPMCYVGICRNATEENH